MAQQYRKKLGQQLEEERHVLLEDLGRMGKEYHVVLLEIKTLLELKNKYAPGGDFDVNKPECVLSLSANWH
jgi:hypothetical protein